MSLQSSQLKGECIEKKSTFNIHVVWIPQNFPGTILSVLLNRSIFQGLGDEHGGFNWDLTVRFKTKKK